MRKILLLLMIFFITPGCEYFTFMSKKEWAEKAGTEDDVIIYLAGAFYDSAAANYLPCYWKITKKSIEKVDLESNNSWGIAYSIFVVGDTVYTCGFDQNPPTVPIRACYWKNKNKYILEAKNPSNVDSQARQIIAKNGVIFIAGIDDRDIDSDYDAVNWIGQNSSGLSAGSISQAQSIFINQLSSTHHVMYIGGINDGQACYWKDGQIFNLENESAASSEVRSIYVSGNTVYSVGDLEYNLACLWKNNNLIKLSGGTVANSVFVSGNDVYIAGQYEYSSDDYPCYWVNNTRYLIPGSSFGVGTNAYAYSIYVYNDNIYIAGVDDNGTDALAWYWTNNKKIFIDQPNYSGVLSIFVTADN